MMGTFGRVPEPARPNAFGLLTPSVFFCPLARTVEDAALMLEVMSGPHPRDPYSRVDILASSRHVRVEVDGVTVAESRQPRILFETGLPPRYYIPLTDVRIDLLRPSDTLSHCPYKGTASYWSVDAGHGVRPDLVWMYRAPLPESQKIAGLACFYNEKADIYVDGELQQRPRTIFS